MPAKHQPGCPCQGCGGSCCNSVCKPCALPQKNLLLSWTNVISGNGSVALTYNLATSTWTSACANGLSYELLCNEGEIELRVIYYTSGACPTGTQQYCSNLRSSPFGLTLSAFTCSPLSLTFSSQSAGCPTITNSGYTQFVVTDPNPVSSPPGLMCQKFCVQCCLSATVDVYSSQGGILLASGTTSESQGCVYLTWQGAPGTYWVTTNGSNCASTAASYNLTCGGQTNIYGGCLQPGQTLTATLVCTGNTFVTTGGLTGAWAIGSHACCPIFFLGLNLYYEISCLGASPVVALSYDTSPNYCTFPAPINPSYCSLGAQEYTCSPFFLQFSSPSCGCLYLNCIESVTFTL